MNLDLATIRSTAIWVLVVIAVIGLALAVIIKKIVGKIVVLVVAAVIVLLGWQQRSRVVNYADSVHSSVCASHPKFFGIDVTYPGCTKKP